MRKKYELEYNIGEDGIYVMSTVSKPAVKSTLVMFSEQTEKQTFEFADDEKQIIYSVAMRPNEWIPREDINGEPADVFYTEETADALLQNFFQKNNHQGGTIDHGGEVVKDMFIFSAWKVLDPARDAATVMGLDVNRGDIVMGQKVNNPEIWKRIKNKELTGFSFEALLNPVLIKTPIKMNLMDPKEFELRTRAVIKMAADEEEAAAKMKEDEEKIEMDKHEDEEKMKLAAHEDEEKKKIEAEAHTPPGTHEMPDGSVMPDADMVPAMQKQIDDLTTENIALKAQVAELEGSAVNMSVETEEAKKTAIEMSAQLAKGLTAYSPAPAAKMKYEDMDNLQKVKFNRGI